MAFTLGPLARSARQTFLSHRPHPLQLVCPISTSLSSPRTLTPSAATAAAVQHGSTRQPSNNLFYLSTFMDSIMFRRRLSTGGEKADLKPEASTRPDPVVFDQSATLGQNRATAPVSPVDASSTDTSPPPSPASPDHNPHRLLTVPNVMTGVRMALSPVIAYQIVMGDFHSAAWTFAGAAFLDWADGWVARTFNQGSLLGSFLDPLSDKVLVACTAAALGWIGVLPIPLLVLVIGRDALLVGGSFYFRAISKRPDEAFFSLTTVEWKVTPSTLSKANTALQLLLVLVGVCNAGWGMPSHEVITGLSWAVAATTFGSAWDYWKNAGLAARGGLSARGMITAKAQQVRERMMFWTRGKRGVSATAPSQRPSNSAVSGNTGAAMAHGHGARPAATSTSTVAPVAGPGSAAVAVGSSPAAAPSAPASPAVSRPHSDGQSDAHGGSGPGPGRGSPV